MKGSGSREWKTDLVERLCGNVSETSRRYSRRVLVPVRTAMVRDEDGNGYTLAEAQQEGWKRHFTKIYNVQSEFDVEELRKVKQ